MNSVSKPAARPTLIICRSEEEQQRLQEVLDDTRVLDDFDVIVVNGVTDDMVTDAARAAGEVTCYVRMDALRCALEAALKVKP